MTKLYKLFFTKEVKFINFDKFQRVMTNITQNVWNILTQDLSIQKNLQRNLINVRALAKYLIKKYHLNASIDSVISAIRRYSSDQTFQEDMATLKEVFVGSNVATKNNLACVIFRKQSCIQKYLTEISKITDFDKSETLRLIKGKSNLKLITEIKYLKKLKKFFPEREKLEIKENLSEIRITTTGMKADKTKGVAARVSNELLTNNINIDEIIFCVPEIIIYVKQENLLKAHESIVRLCSGE